MVPGARIPAIRMVAFGLVVAALTRVVLVEVAELGPRMTRHHLLDQLVQVILIEQLPRPQHQLR